MWNIALFLLSIAPIKRILWQFPCFSQGYDADIQTGIAMDLCSSRQNRRFRKIWLRTFEWNMQCYSLCDDVTHCVTMLLTVWRCYSLCDDVTHCVTMLLTVWRCYSLCDDVTHCVTMLLTVWWCYSLCDDVTHCVTMLLTVWRCHFRSM